MATESEVSQWISDLAYVAELLKTAQIKKRVEAFKEYSKHAVKIAAKISKVAKEI